eukprot:877036-Prymnesium_polylepis.1
MNKVAHPFDMAPLLQQGAKSIEAQMSDPTKLMQGRARLFTDHVAPEPSPLHVSIYAELAGDGELAGHVRNFLHVHAQRL